MMEEIILPAEVWLNICEQLEKERDFQSLFNCALVKQVVAGAAVKSLYRIHSFSPVISEGIDLESGNGLDMKGQYALQVKAISKWALQWRSIILSSLGQTMYPYCLYIKSLDFRNLSQLFENGLFRDNVQDSFFTDELSTLITASNLKQPKKLGKQSARRQNLRYNDDVSRDVIGESITKFIYSEAQRSNSVAALEEVSGNIPLDTVFTWCGRLARLKTLTLWNGSSLSKKIAIHIKQNCPDFNSLTIFSHMGDDADNSLAEFFKYLSPNSLSYFEMIHSNDIHEQTFESLSTHSESLTELKLASLKSNAIRCLPLLKECTNLETFLIQDREGVVDLENTDKEACETITTWLKSCKNLKNLTIDTIRFGAYIVVPVLFDTNIKLHKFEMLKFISTRVYDALSTQESLEELKLRGDPPVDLGIPSDEILVDSITALPKLKVLDLLGLSDRFKTKQFKTLCNHLIEVRSNISTVGMSMCSWGDYRFFCCNSPPTQIPPNLFKKQLRQAFENLSLCRETGQVAVNRSVWPKEDIQMIQEFIDSFVEVTLTPGEPHPLFILGRVASPLPVAPLFLELRELSISGTDLTDVVLPHLSKLSHLQSLHLTALTQFSFDALEAYIASLSPNTNANFILAIMSQALEYDLSAEEQETLRRMLREKVDGKFDFVLYREDSDDFEGYETEMGE